MAAQLESRSFTVSEYHRMVETGILDDGERVELLDGVIVTMPPIGVSHWWRHGNAVDYLSQRLRGRARVHGQISLPLGKCNEPEPDIAILADLPYEKLNRVPVPAEIYAMIELSDSSLPKDTTIKRRLYAQFEIADYLVVDLNDDVLLHFTAPSGGDYPAPRLLGHGDSFALKAVPDVELSADPFLRAI